MLTSITILDSIPVARGITIDLNLSITDYLLTISPVFPVISSLPSYLKELIVIIQIPLNMNRNLATRGKIGISDQLYPARTSISRPSPCYLIDKKFLP